MNSIVQDLSEERCFRCGSTANLDLHHIMHGTANRRWSSKYGLLCWMCRPCHQLVHCDVLENKRLQRVAQIAFEKAYSRKLWMEVFGKNYL